MNTNRDILRSLLVTFIESNYNEWRFEFLSFKKNTKAKNNIPPTLNPTLNLTDSVNKSNMK